MLQSGNIAKVVLLLQLSQDILHLVEQVLIIRPHTLINNDWVWLLPGNLGLGILLLLWIHDGHPMAVGLLDDVVVHWLVGVVLLLELVVLLVNKKLLRNGVFIAVLLIWGVISVNLRVLTMNLWNFWVFQLSHGWHLNNVLGVLGLAWVLNDELLLVLSLELHHVYTSLVHALLVETLDVLAHDWQVLLNDLVKKLLHHDQVLDVFLDNLKLLV